jgi:hypothetical protein
MSSAMRWMVGPPAVAHALASTKKNAAIDRAIHPAGGDGGIQRCIG